MPKLGCLKGGLKNFWFLMAELGGVEGFRASKTQMEPKSMSSDGPKNSQGYIRYPEEAGMTNEPYFIQLLGYTGGEWTEQVANAWIRHASECFAHAARSFPLARRRSAKRSSMKPCTNI
ncbi:hypothetical protein WOA01_23965 [Methylocystis sp. IM2]|uniref:hypothetical protein n=1 Tax=Methylocystis sp. IM2 TaxID=3136563 RepID=UPI0030FC05BE